MKKFLFVIVVGLCLLCGEAYGQEYIEPQWKFYFAFEDATGSKDTLWFVLDSAATFWNSWVPPYTNGWDPQFGETPVELNEGGFNVWTYNYEEPYNPNPPKFKLLAYPMSYTPEVMIYANNYTLPITLSWDTALFNAPVLQATEAGPICNPGMSNEWFFFNTNADWLHHAFSMLFDTQVVLPEFWWGSQDHFPIGVGLERAHDCNLLSTKIEPLAPMLQLYPNPCSEVLILRTEAGIVEVKVYNLQGKMVLQEDNAFHSRADTEVGLDVRALPPGMYVLHMHDAQGHRGVRKFVKSD